MEMGLVGKNVLITGSTKGIGKASAEIFAEEGANVIISGRNEQEADKVASSIMKEYGVNAVGIASDLSVIGAAEELFAKSIEVMGTVDILVNNAGIWPTAYVADMEKEEFEKTVYFNLEVPYILSRLCVNHFLEQKNKGKIVNVVSQAAFHGSTTGHAHYAAAKAGLVTFMISQAREVAKYGININGVAPGIVRTPMTEKLLKINAQYYQERIPIGRVAEAEDVANVIVFLASKSAEYLTGITVDATGGMLMR
ncbi:SDR family NAD(P)-dependent oxidoreductase [Chakrabartyella piscis]|uniref:SDR family NAD(P)-dependent oxidoreductase n=1 Tax=Chakrabartyella piscis TaxID=2918914 RepID=UPI002958B5EB|nr:SDR family NAD(P)-dependent oxidoreductase [Chakrabartyella piscis]